MTEYRGPGRAALVRLGRGIIVAFSLVLPVTHAAMAAPALSCGDLSPAKQNGLDLFSEEQVEVLPPSERKVLLKLFKRMRGQWRGRYKKMICLLGAEGAYPKEDEATVYLDALWVRGDTLQMDWEVRHSSVLGRERGQLYFELKGDYLRVGADIHRRDVIVLETGADRLKTYWRYTRARPGLDVPLAVEEGTAISLKGRKLTVRRVSFINGELAGVEIWHLQR